MTPRTGFTLFVTLLLIPLASALVFPKETLFFDRLNPGNEQIKLINNDEILFTKIGVTTNTNITRGRVIVQAMPDCPENAPYQENVLQCFFITTQSFDDNDISSTKVGFKVKKDWLTSNNFNTLELRRYSYSWNNNLQGDLSEWKPLKTTLENEDETYFYYLSEADGFSYFSIVGSDEVIAEEVVNEPVQVEEIPIEEQPVTSLLETPEEVIIQVPKSSMSYEWLSVIIVAVLSLVASLAIPKNNVQKPSTPLDEITDYIKSSNKSEDELRDILKANGWEDWQINLAMKESKR